MDDRRFDALARSLARATSRRGAIKGLVGGVISSAALSHRLFDVAAQKLREAAQLASRDERSSRPI